MEKIYLINEEYIKTFSEIQDNLLIKKVLRSVWLCQNIYIKKLLGTVLYNYIIEGVKNDTLVGLYETILNEYVQPTLLEYSLYKSCPHMAYSLTNRGVVSKESDNATSIDLDELQYLQNEYLRTAEQLFEQTINFLKAQYCKGFIPEYGENCEIDEIKPTQDTDYGFGIYLG